MHGGEMWRSEGAGAQKKAGLNIVAGAQRCSGIVVRLPLVITIMQCIGPCPRWSGIIWRSGAEHRAMDRSIDQFGVSRGLVDFGMLLILRRASALWPKDTSWADSLHYGGVAVIVEDSWCA